MQTHLRLVMPRIGTAEGQGAEGVHATPAPQLPRVPPSFYPARNPVAHTETKLVAKYNVKPHCDDKYAKL